MAEQQALEESILLRFILAGCRGMGGKASVSEIEKKFAGSLGRESEDTMAAVPAAATMVTRSTGKLSRNDSSSSFLRLIIGRGR